MTAERTPKVGEVWTSHGGLLSFTCVVDVPDADGDYVWSSESDKGPLYEFAGSRHLTPPKPQPPTWLVAAPWRTCEPSDIAGAWPTAEAARRNARWNTLGVLNVLTGEWVPR